jgi:hypothetical protein
LTVEFETFLLKIVHGLEDLRYAGLVRELLILTLKGAYASWPGILFILKSPGVKVIIHKSHVVILFSQICSAEALLKVLIEHVPTLVITCIVIIGVTLSIHAASSLSSEHHITIASIAHVIVIRCSTTT